MNNPQSWVLIAGSYLIAFSASGEILQLSEGEMAERVGGTDINVLSINPGERTQLDNLYIRGEVETILQPPGQVTISQNVGNGKHVASTIATSPNGQVISGFSQEEGEWITSLLYPLNNPPSNIVFRVCNIGEDGSLGNPCTLIPDSGGTLVNVDIDDDVHVRGVWFHNMVDGAQAAYIPSYVAKGLVDWTTNGNASSILVNGQLPAAASTTDAIWTQCPVDETLQFRSIGYDNVDATGWMFSFNTDYTMMNIEPAPNAIPAAYRNHALSIDPGRDYIHVYIVNGFTTGGAGVPSNAVGLSNSLQTNLIAIKDSFINGNAQAIAARVLAHEIAHSQSLAHASFPCSGGSSSRLMCGNINLAGDGLLAGPGYGNANECLATYWGKPLGVSAPLTTLTNLNQ